MNPLIPTNAIQIRYESPQYEPYYDEDGNIIDEDCVDPGTDVWQEFVRPVHDDGIPRYYRLRYRGNAKDHKHRMKRQIHNSLTSDDYCCVKVSVIGRRVLFTYDPKLSLERDKLLKRQEFLAKKRKRIQEQQAAAQAAGPAEDTWESFTLHEKLDEMLGVVPQEEERLIQVAREIYQHNRERNDHDEEQ